MESSTSEESRGHCQGSAGDEASGYTHSPETCHAPHDLQASSESTSCGLPITRVGNGSSSGSSTAEFPSSDDVTSDLESGTQTDAEDTRSARHADVADPIKCSERGRTYDLKVDRLSYWVAKRTGLGKLQRKCLLKGVSASANHGEILAIAGASGAGKTTFLDAVAGNISHSSLKGSIMVNGQPMDGSFRTISGYVTQDDHLLPMLTVQETLLFSARLRLPQSMAHQEKVARVEALLTQLGLTSCKDTLVGNTDVRGISGGERRRTSIGVELVHDPRVLYLDEPTSGLDSGGALGVMRVLKDLAAREHRTIILTIHQPSARILKLIDRFLILWGGRGVYHGPCSKMSSYFEDIAGPRDPEESNALEFALDVLREAESTKNKRISGSFEFQKQVAQSSSQPPSTDGGLLLEEGEGETPNTDATTSIKGEGVDSREGPSGSLTQHFACSFASEVITLSERCIRTTLRTKELFLARIFIFILCGIIAGTLFLNSGHDLDGANNRLSFFAYTVAAAFFTSTDAIPAFLEERWIYKRETSRGAYRTASYVIAGALVYIPFLLVIAIVYSAIPYYMIGLAPEFSNFVVFTLTVFLSLMVANSFVCFVASVVPNFTLGSALSTAVSALFLLFSGFFISESNIPPYWVWMNYISTFKYPLQLLIINEFGGDPDKCWNYAQGPNGEDTGMCTYSSQDILEKFSVQDVSLWVPAIVMVVFYVGYRGLFCGMLKLQTAQKRH